MTVGNQTGVTKAHQPTRAGMPLKLGIDMPASTSAYLVLAYMVMAYIVMAYIAMADIAMVYIAMAYIVMAYILMAYIATRAAATPPANQRRYEFEAGLCRDNMNGSQHR